MAPVADRMSVNTKMEHRTLAWVLVINERAWFFLVHLDSIGLASATSQLDRNAWQRVATYKSGSKLNKLRGAWRDRDTNDIFAHCSLIFYFIDFKFSNFFWLTALHPFIWFFFKKSLRKKKNIRKTTQNALAPSIFIVLSIVVKPGTPLLHTQAQNRLLQNF